MNEGGFERLRALRAKRRWLTEDPDRLRDHQDRAVRAVVSAALHAPAYREIYADVDTGGIGLGELERLPIVDRASFGVRPLQDRLADPEAEVVTAFSSGTSGRISEFAWSREEDDALHIQWARQVEVMGLRMDARLLVLHMGGQGRQADLVVTGPRAEFGAFAPPEAIERAFHDYRPEVLAGPPSALLELADRIGPQRLHGLVAGGEVLDPGSRDALHEAFGVEPIDQYGSTEAGRTSWQCARREMLHVNADDVVVEVLGPDGRAADAGVAGDVVVTALWNRTAPIIRYRVGDTAALLDERCACGVMLPLMSAVDGRTNDWVILADGSRVSPLRLAIGVLVPECKETVRRYRVLQREPDDFLVEVQWRGEPMAGLAEQLTDAFTWTLGTPVRAEVRSVERVGERGRKHRLVESLVGR